MFFLKKRMLFFRVFLKKRVPPKIGKKNEYFLVIFLKKVTFFFFRGIIEGWLVHKKGNFLKNYVKKTRFFLKN